MQLFQDRPDGDLRCVDVETSGRAVDGVRQQRCIGEGVFGEFESSDPFWVLLDNFWRRFPLEGGVEWLQ